MMKEADIQEFVEQVNRTGGTYHKMELKGGYVLDGEYDMKKYLPYYGFPPDLTEWSVLDIGTSSGFFAFEFERRGGLVTAIDIWDGEMFRKIAQTLDSKVVYKQKNIYELNKDFGAFDFVFCGSLLLHLSDLFEAVRRIYAVCKKEAVIATAIMSDSRCNDLPHCQFVGARGKDADYWVTWVPNMETLKQMCLAAGFSKVEKISAFSLESEPRKKEFSSLHGVVKAFV